jgi:alkanesulfonate monooxygenase SsuD/methylene tetrahydromethanopterin reductase-like flavin-dependent oxidoreductase (luciferase family)
MQVRRLIDRVSADPSFFRQMSTLERCEAHDRPPGATAIRRGVHVGADAADASRVAGPVLARGYRGFPADATIVGDVATVADEFRSLADAGFSDVLIRHLADDQGEVLASFERMAEVRTLVADV